MSDRPAAGERLDSWKAIAAHLQRDVATVARWEKNLGLPVHRVAGAGRSVFAYTSEIDDWLKTASPTLPPRDTPPAPAPAGRPIRSYPWRWMVPAGALLVLVVSMVALPRTITADDLRVELTSAGVIARDSTGDERWKYSFPAAYRTYVPEDPNNFVQVTGGTSPAIYFATHYRERQPGAQPEGGELAILDLKGRLQRSFSFADRVTFHGVAYGSPWMITGFAVNEARHVAVAAHHHVWDPGLVTILDDRWQRRGTFVHAGWIEHVQWLGQTRLAISGFSNAHDGGMIALLDAAALDGQGPEPPGSRHFCATCGPGRPLRMFVFPRTEVNRVTASRFNRAVLQPFGDRLIARTIEMPRGLEGDADALYEFTLSLDVVRASFSERYWEIHRALEAEGKINHTRDECPDRDGPREILMWQPATGWQTLRLR